MNLLFKHNLAAGWRNILKYKTQNIISVLCLSVGVVLFTLTVIILYSDDISVNSDIYGITLWEEEDMLHFVNYDAKNISTIRDLPSVKSVYVTASSSCSGDIKDDKGKHYYRGKEIAVWNNEILRYYGLKSAISGKSLEQVANRTVLLTDQACSAFFPGGINPIGYEIGVSGLYTSKEIKELRVGDIISTKGLHVGLPPFIVVTDENHITDYLPSFSIRVSLNKGYTYDDLCREMKQAFPKFKSEVHHHTFSDENEILLSIFFFLGISILLIGLTGYLKMQIQLFMLRSREMSLRRQNGAKTVHLFLLLCAELLILFTFVLGVSMLISWELYDFVVLTRVDFDSSSNPWPLSSIMCIETWITIATLVASVGIAWFAVRRTIKSPLCQTVGTSYSPTTKGHGILQTIQFIVANILLAVILLISFSVGFAFPTKYENDIMQYKRIAPIFTTTDCAKKLQQLPSVEKVERYRMLQYDINSPEDTVGITKGYLSDVFRSDTLLGKHDEPRRVYGRIYELSAWQMINPRTSIMPSDSPDKNESGHVIPVYATISDAEQVCSELGIKHKPSAKRYSLKSGNQFVRLGYVHQLDIDKHREGYIAFHIITAQKLEKLMMNSADSLYLRDFGFETYVLAKAGCYESLCNELDKMEHQSNPELSNNYHIKVPSLYDKLFDEYDFYLFIVRMIVLVTVVCIISIILTVFSSVSLETRRRQKEIAIRKAHGAKARDIVKIFCRSYIVKLIITLVVVIAIIILGSYYINVPELLIDFIAVILGWMIIVLITIITIWHKIYKAVHVNVAEIIKKE